jgi:hypothetical protein
MNELFEIIVVVALSENPDIDFEITPSPDSP